MTYKFIVDEVFPVIEEELDKKTAESSLLSQELGIDQLTKINNYNGLGYKLQEPVISSPNPNDLPEQFDLNFKIESQPEGRVGVVAEGVAHITLSKEETVEPRGDDIVTVEEVSLDLEESIEDIVETLITDQR